MQVAPKTAVKIIGIFRLREIAVAQMASFPSHIQSARTRKAAAKRAPEGPPRLFALPAKAEGEGAPVIVGVLELPIMLLTIKDGQAVPSETGGLDLVTVTSGAGPDAQEVPQAAVTVDCKQML